MLNNQDDRIFDLIPLFNGHLLQLVGCSCCIFIRRDLMAVLLPTESVVKMACLKILLSGTLFISLAAELSRLMCRGGDVILSGFVAEISYNLFIFRMHSLVVEVYSRE